MITREELQKCMPKATSENVEKYWAHINNAMFRYGMSTDNTIAPFLANISIETKQLLAMEENLNYSEQGLLKTFPGKFDSVKAKQYAHKPEAIANYVYANRYGNKDENSGDGWRYRGRGGMMTTFKNNYDFASKGLSYDFINKPDDMVKPGAAMLSAAFFWESHHLNDISEPGTEESYFNVCKIINGLNKSTGLPNGWEERKANWEICKQALK